jgi:hypothetical protein
LPSAQTLSDADDRLLGGPANSLGMALLVGLERRRVELASASA